MRGPGESYSNVFLRLASESGSTLKPPGEILPTLRPCMDGPYACNS